MDLLASAFAAPPDGILGKSVSFEGGDESIESPMASLASDRGSLRGAVCTVAKFEVADIGSTICFGCIGGSGGSKFCIKIVDDNSSITGTCGVKSHQKKFEFKTDSYFIIDECQLGSYTCFFNPESKDSSLEVAVEDLVKNFKVKNFYKVFIRSIEKIWNLRLRLTNLMMGY